MRLRGLACCCLVLAQGAAGPVHGGKITIGLGAEPKTLNPLTAADEASREVIGRMSAGLIALDRQTHKPKAALAEGWQASANGLHYTVRLRNGLRFSDGKPFGVDDVLFSFRVCVRGKIRPTSVTKVDGRTVRFDLAAPTAEWAQMLADVPMLPRHLLGGGTLNEMWGLEAKPESVAGMGPFRLKEYNAGQRLVLERNPYYWGTPKLPFDELDYVFTAQESADVLMQVNARDVALLRSKHFEVRDLGPGAEALCLVLQAGIELPAAIDRARIVKAVYGGFADVAASERLSGNSEAFKISISAGNTEEEAVAKLIQEDLARVGGTVEIVPGKADARLKRCGEDEPGAVRLVVPHRLVAASERFKQWWF